MHPRVLLIEDTISLVGMDMPVRCIAIGLSRGQVVLISPTRNIDQYEEQINLMGKVVAIVEPNLFHHLFVKKAQSLFPGARLYGVQGLLKKRADVPWTAALAPGTWPWQDELEVVPIEGLPRLQEHVFFFREGKLLVVCDLCFNLQDPKGILAGILLRLFGTWKKLAVSRLFTTFMNDRRHVSRSLERVLSLDFCDLVMAHGDPVEGSGKEALELACRQRGLLDVTV